MTNNKNIGAFDLSKVNVFGTLIRKEQGKSYGTKLFPDKNCNFKNDVL